MCEPLSLPALHSCFCSGDDRGPEYSIFVGELGIALEGVRFSDENDQQRDLVEILETIHLCVRDSGTLQFTLSIQFRYEPGWNIRYVAVLPSATEQLSNPGTEVFQARFPSSFPSATLRR